MVKQHGSPWVIAHYAHQWSNRTVSWCDASNVLNTPSVFSPFSLQRCQLLGNWFTQIKWRHTVGTAHKIDVLILAFRWSGRPAKERYQDSNLCHFLDWLPLVSSEKRISGNIITLFPSTPCFERVWGKMSSSFLNRQSCLKHRLCTYLLVHPYKTRTWWY